MKYLIDAQALLNVLPFVYKTDDRPMIQAVQVRGNRIFATNGAVIIGHELSRKANTPARYTKIDLSTKFAIPIFDVEKITAFVENAKTNAYVVYDITTEALSDFAESVCLPLNPLSRLYDFPDILSVIPLAKDLKPISHINIDAAYLYALGSINKRTHQLEIYGAGDICSPLVVRPQQGGWLALVMPCKLSQDDANIKSELSSLLADLSGNVEKVSRGIQKRS